MTVTMATSPSSENMTSEPEEKDAAKSSRRKACDLCFNKKIKCDMLKPICSNCILYNTKCKTSSIRRKVIASKERAPVSAVASRGSNENLENRLGRIERQLQQVLDAAKSAHTATIAKESVAKAQNFVFEEAQRSEADYGKMQLDESWSFDPVQPSIYRGPEPEDLLLPPVEEALPSIENFFNTYNILIPIFNRRDFMRMVSGWYSHTIPHDKATWAAILIAMAVGLRVPNPGILDITPENTQRADVFMRNAQSVVSELVTRDTDLLGLQVLLCIVSLFQNSRDAKPASVIIGTALRLAHRLKLHSKDSAQHFSEDETRQRSFVFWVAYLYDKDISLRATTPSIQDDTDIDVPLPPLSSPDGVGYIWTADGRNHYNYFRHRIDLSHIEGKIYDLLYSNRASKAPAPERQRRVAHLQAMLDKWYQSVPVAFRIEHVASTVSPSNLVQMTKLLHAYLLAEVMTHGIYSHDTSWVNRIDRSNRGLIEDDGSDADDGKSASSRASQAPPLPQGWPKCVEISRGCMKLFQYAMPTECLLWQCSCAHFSALIIILANMILFPSHPSVSLDQYLASKSVQLFNKLGHIIAEDNFESLRKVVLELHQKANTAVEAARVKHGSAGDAGVFDEFGMGLDGFDPADPGFSTFDGEAGAFMSSLHEDNLDPAFEEFDPELGTSPTQESIRVNGVPNFLL